MAGTVSSNTDIIIKDESQISSAVSFKPQWSISELANLLAKYTSWLRQQLTASQIQLHYNRTTASQQQVYMKFKEIFGGLLNNYQFFIDMYIMPICQ